MDINEQAPWDEVTILVAEDDLEMLELLDRVLRDENFNVIQAKSGKEAISLIKTEQFDLVLTDLKMPGASGIEVLRAARAKFLHQPVIMMTAFGTIDSAVEAMKEGAYSYITKPFDINDLVTILQDIASQVRLRKKAFSLSTIEGEQTAFPIVFRSEAFREVINIVNKIATSSASVLITGESGSGKELVAREIHRQSDRREKPFVAIDANAIPETLLESELFGHVKGAFTGAGKDKIGIIEQAHTGTLFLDEIGNLNLGIQAKLLRFLQERKFRRVGDAQEREVDIRLITATNRDLGMLIETDDFREDLFYRLSVVNLIIPALRDRCEDIPLLAYYFLRKFNDNFRVEGFRPDVLDILTDFDWPGNVRQLENAVEHAVILRKAGLIEKDDLPNWLTLKETSDGSKTRSLEIVERNHILRVLEMCDDNKSRAAKVLGINRRTLARKLISYGICKKDEDE